MKIFSKLSFYVKNCLSKIIILKPSGQQGRFGDNGGMTRDRDTFQ